MGSMLPCIAAPWILWDIGLPLIAGFTHGKYGNTYLTLPNKNGNNEEITELGLHMTSLGLRSQPS